VTRPVTVHFFVPGTPVGQGNHRQSRYGKTYETTKGHAAWRKTVATYTLTQRARCIGGPINGTFIGPVRASFAFQLPHPVRCRRVWPSVKPDLSKLIRAVEDGLVVGGLLADDSLIVELSSRKTYASNIEPVGVHVVIESLEERP